MTFTGNLFIKSLPSSYTSASLSTLFSPYGSIVSALVVKDPQTQRSKEFGFVSFRTPEEARSALEGIDGRMVDGRKVTVRLHEPKRVREGRLSGGSASASGKDGMDVNVIEKGVRELQVRSLHFFVTINSELTKREENLADLDNILVDSLSGSHNSCQVGS